MKSCSVWNLFLIMIHTLSADTARGREASWAVSYCGNTSSKGGGGGGGSVFHSYSCATYILWFLEYTGRVKPSIFHVWVMHRLLPPSAHKSPAFRQGSFKSWRWGSVPRGSTSCLRGRRQTPPVSAKDQLRRLWNVRGSLMAKELC